MTRRSARQTCLLTAVSTLLACTTTFDRDGDGFSAARDCDDGDADVGAASTWYLDIDGDGAGSQARGASLYGCGQPAGTVSEATDCDDDDPGLYDGAEETCGDGQVNDCAETPETLDATDCTFTNSLVIDAVPLAASYSGARVGSTVALTEMGLALAARSEAGDKDVAAVLDATWDRGLALREDDAWLDELGDEVGAAIQTWEASAALTWWVVGAPGAGAGAGAVYLYKGTIATGDASDAAVQTLMGEEVGDEFGRATAVGDLDGDGVLELIVGAPGAKADAGLVYLVWGDDALWDESGEGTPDLVEALADTASAAGDRSGAALAAGDLDGDGLDELVIGEPGVSEGAGRVVVCGLTDGGLSELGRRSGADGERLGGAMALAQADDEPGAELLIGGPGDDAERGRIHLRRGAAFDADSEEPLPIAIAATWSGATEGDQLGAALAWGPDLDADGQLDVLAGAPGADEGRGALLALSTAEDGSHGDASDSALFSFTGADAGAALGASVSSGVDLDGDGLWEIAVGAPADGEGTAWLLRARNW